MRLLLPCLMLLLFSLATLEPAYGQNATRARTEEGREVLLFPDGTWKYAGTASPPPVMVSKSPSAKTEFKTQKGQFSIWVNTTKWQLPRRPATGAAEYEFAHKSGDGYAMIIAERLSMPLESLKEIVLEIAQESDPDAKIISEERKVVNGQNILAMKMAVTVKGIPFIYYGYYYTGDAGTLQVVTYTGKNLFKEYEQDFTEFLNGTTIHPPNQ